MTLTRSMHLLAFCLSITGAAFSGSGVSGGAHLADLPDAGGVRGAAAEGGLVSFNLLDNGNFTEVYAGKDPARRGLIPWWRVTGDVGRIEDGGRTWGVTAGDGTLFQPVAAFEKSAAGVEISGRLRGQGRLVVTDGAGGRTVFELSGAAPAGSPFLVTGADIAAAFGRDLTPRIELVLSSGNGQSTAWTNLQCLVPLPVPTEPALARELVVVLDGIFSLWIERGMRTGTSDGDGGLLTNVFDANTGQPLYQIPGGLSPLHEALLDATAVLGDGAPAPWTEALDAFLTDYFTLCLHPQTGLPRRVDPASGKPLTGQHIEAAADLGFLLDLVERGPVHHRDRARAAAILMGETILAHGILPDGTVAPKYRAEDANTSTAAPPLRRLDVPAQLARLGALTGEGGAERFFQAARNALAELEFTHHWTGEWRDIDPGFDDDFGHYGARSAVMFAAAPDEPAFGALADSGLAHYTSRWRDALRFGATMAADQVRCWELLADHAHARPAILPILNDLFPAAAASHFKSQQRSGAIWEDLTYVHFDPKANLQVGDLGGVPANLLLGLAVTYEDRFGLRTDRTRALFAAVLHTTIRHYRRPHGLLYTRNQPGGPNPAGGGIRIASALVRMLENLRR